MAEVSFYILPTESIEERDEFACKLIEKIYRSGFYCYVLTDNVEQSKQIDDLLWTFRASSFIPHQQYKGELPIIDEVILVGHFQPPDRWQHTLINLSAQCPNQFTYIERILEILDGNEATKEKGRIRYRQYQESGIKIKTYQDW